LIGGCAYKDYLRSQLYILILSKKILITGGTGFIGSYIIKELVEKGYSVRAIRRSNKLPFYISTDILNKVEWLNGDVLDIPSLEDAMTGADAVIHSAAVVSFLRSEKKEMYKTNIEGTANVVNVALEKNIKRLVHVSSVAVFGNTGKLNHVNEEKKWQENKINTAYSISKHKSELEVWRAIAEGLDAVIINPSTVLGFGDWNTTSCRIFKTVYDEFPWYTQGINGFVDVTDVAKATVALLESGISNERFIVTGENWTFQQLFNAIADGFGKKHPHRNATLFLSEIAWRAEVTKAFFTGRKPLLTKESARVAHRNTYFDNKKILAALPGFSFLSLQESIQIACKQYLDTINRVQR